MMLLLVNVVEVWVPATVSASSLEARPKRSSSLRIHYGLFLLEARFEVEMVISATTGFLILFSATGTRQ